MKLENLKRNFNLKRLIEMLKINCPQEWREACPRIYKNVDNYHDYRQSAANTAPILFQWKVMDQKTFAQIQSNTEAKEMMLSALIGRRYAFPLFFVNRDLFEAAMLTASPDEIDWREMPFPFDSMVFVLPRGILKVGGESVAYLQITKVKQGAYTVGEYSILMVKDYLIVNAFTASNVHYFTTRNDVYTPDQTLETRTEHELQFEIDNTEEQFLKRLPGIIFNILFAMQARPELVETGRKISTSKKSKSEIWTPNVIGAKYRSPKKEDHGTHASPRMHWRRGHFRRQNYGVGFAEQKMIWIEPVLVGVKND